jgi:hypothetical protein
LFCIWIKIICIIGQTCGVHWTLLTGFLSELDFHCRFKAYKSLLPIPLGVGAKPLKSLYGKGRKNAWILKPRK